MSSEMHFRGGWTLRAYFASVFFSHAAMSGFQCAIDGSFSQLISVKTRRKILRIAQIVPERVLDCP